MSLAGGQPQRNRGWWERIILNPFLNRINNARCSDSAAKGLKLGRFEQFSPPASIWVRNERRPSPPPGTARPSHILQPQDQGHTAKTLCAELKLRSPLGLIRISSRTRSDRRTERHVLHMWMETNNARKLNFKYFSIIPAMSYPIGNTTLYARVVRIGNKKNRSLANGQENYY